jgi:hypothetical protein
MHFNRSRRVLIIAAPLAGIGEGDRAPARFIRAGKKILAKNKTRHDPVR